MPAAPPPLPPSLVPDAVPQAPPRKSAQLNRSIGAQRNRTAGINSDPAAIRKPTARPAAPRLRRHVPQKAETKHAPECETVPTINAFLNDIAAGPDNNLWFTEGGGNKIGRITP
jgi:hypothetical protein